MGSRTPSDKINLRLILVSGKTKEFLFSPSDSAADIAQHVFDNWPIEWSAEAVSKAEILRLIYQGRFLHGNVTLGALQLPLGRTTVMHLIPRENLPEPNSQDQRHKKTFRSVNKLEGCLFKENKLWSRVQTSLFIINPALVFACILLTIVLVLAFLVRRNKNYWQ